MTPRATPMTPQQRRQSLIEATIPLLCQHGTTATSKQIAQAAGVAEGTIFRVFDSKDDLLQAAIAEAFKLDDLIAAIQAYQGEGGIEERVVFLVDLQQRRVKTLFALMRAIGRMGPEHKHQDAAETTAIAADRRRLDRAVIGVLTAGNEQFALPTSQLPRVLHGLCFALSGIGPDHASTPMSPRDIAHIFLHGTLKDHR